jgi:hypothetical protein
MVKSFYKLFNVTSNLMHSEIQNITPYYSKFENILPEELPDTRITEELVRARNEINSIIEEDLKKIKIWQQGRIDRLCLMSSQSLLL